MENIVIYKDYEFIFTRKLMKDKFENEVQDWIDLKSKVFFNQYRIDIEDLDIYFAFTFYIRCEKSCYKVRKDGIEIDMDNYFYLGKK